MGIRIKKLNVLISTFDYEPIYPGNLLGKSEVIEYEVEHPFPATDYYGRSDMILDMQHDHGGGILTFGDGVTDDQIDWIEEFLNEMV